MRIKTSELVGSALDWAVAKSAGELAEDGGQVHIVGSRLRFYEDTTDLTYSPSTNWAQGGPIIEREGIAIGSHLDGEEWIAEDYWREATWSGPTPLVAAMRCFVASHLGDEVEVPEGLTA